MTVRKRQRAAKNHATKNRRISGASRSAHARAHYQDGVVDKPPLEKMAPKDDGTRVVASWPAIEGASLYRTKSGTSKAFYIEEKDIKNFPLVQSHTKRTKDGAPMRGAIKLKELLGAEGKLICCSCKVVLGAKVCGVKGNEIGSLSVSCFQLDHIDPKRPTMSQGQSYKDYLDAYEQNHIAIKCYECIGLQYNLQGKQHAGNTRKYAKP
jgi:hypothetical protein